MSQDTPASPSDVILKPSRPPVSADMNVTPLIDVLLVLLIVFMAALPLTQRGLDTDLPSPAPGPTQPDPTQIVVEYLGNRRLTINQQPLTLDEAPRKFHDIFMNRHNKTIFIVGAPEVPYGEIMAIIDAAKGAGVDRIGIITQSMKKPVNGQ